MKQQTEDSSRRLDKLASFQIAVACLLVVLMGVAAILLDSQRRKLARRVVALEQKVEALTADMDNGHADRTEAAAREDATSDRSERRRRRESAMDHEAEEVAAAPETSTAAEDSSTGNRSSAPSSTGDAHPTDTDHAMDPSSGSDHAAAEAGDLPHDADADGDHPTPPTAQAEDSEEHAAASSPGSSRPAMDGSANTPLNLAEQLAALAAEGRPSSRAAVEAIRKALRQYDQLPPDDPQRTAPEVLLPVAELHLLMLDDAASLAAAQRALDAGAPAGPALFVMARAQLLAEKPEAARELIERAVAAPDAPPQALLMLADFELQAGNAAGAEQALNGALDFPATEVEAAVRLANLALDRGDLTAADRFVRRAAARAGDTPAVDRCRARLLHAQGKLAEALPLAQRLVDRDPQDGAMLLVLTDGLLHAQQSHLALGHAQTLVQLMPLNPEAHEMLGRALMARLQFEEAGEAFNHAIQLDDERPRTWYYLGIAAANAEDFEAALLAFEASLDQDDAQPEVLFAQAVCLAQTGNDRQAREALDLAIELDPQLSDAAAQVEVFEDLPASRKRKKDS
jgi:tetratricopeptide (TPR) repeat protein